jgi:hypothetical protein
MRERTAKGWLPWLGLAGLVVGVALYRVFPRVYLSQEAGYFWNLMPVGALGLFVGSRLRSWHAYLVPAAAMLLADLLLIRPLADKGGAFSWGTPILYASFTLNVLIGRLLGPRTFSPVAIAGAAVLGSAQFFLASNFLVWVGGTRYAQDLGGLWQCYVAALPFYKNDLAGNLLFSGLFFGIHALALRVGALSQARQPA